MTRSEILKMSDAEINKVVKIEGTNYDRKRKVTKQMAYRMKQMFNSGKSLNFIATHFGVTPKTVRYNIDEDYRRRYLDTNPGGHTPSYSSPAERGAYKRMLVESRKNVIMG